MRKKIIFMGTPDFATPTLQALLNSEHEILAVYTAAPKPAGRGNQLRKSPVHELAEANNLQVITPHSLKQETLPDCDVAVVVAYGLLLPEHILTGPKYGCLNLHPSALPRWRGAAPLQRTIISGDKQSSVCIMQMDKGLDTGAVMLREDFTIPENMTCGDLHDKCAQIGVKLILQTISEIESIIPKKQSEEGVTYAKKITKEDERINWSKSAYEISCLVRGLNPFPGAYFEHNGEKIKIWECEIVEGNGNAGEVLDDKLTIACGTGAIKITNLQKQGKKAMSARDFLAGNKIAKGEKLN